MDAVQVSFVGFVGGLLCALPLFLLSGTCPSLTCSGLSQTQALVGTEAGSTSSAKAKRGKVAPAATDAAPLLSRRRT